MRYGTKNIHHDYNMIHTQPSDWKCVIIIVITIIIVIMTIILICFTAVMGCSMCTMDYSNTDLHVQKEHTM
jgi:hypothetical protein